LFIRLFYYLKPGTY